MTLHQIAKEFRSWCESCKCHFWMHKDSAGDVSNAAAGYFDVHCDLGLGDKFCGDTCPLAGMRASEFATSMEGGGGGQHSLHQIRDQIYPELIRMCNGLSEIDRASLLADFNLGRAQLAFNITSKLHYWDALPWKLVGLSHWSEGVSRRCAQKCLELFDNAVQEEAMHHRISWEFLAPGCELRRQLQAFASGSQPLWTWPELHRRVLALTFINVAERRGEADHSLISKAAVGRKPAPPAVSLSLRMPEVLEAIGTSPAQVHDFCAHFNSVRNPRDAVVAQGLSRHPTIKEALERNAAYHEMHTLLQSVVYGTDPESMFYKDADGVLKLHDKSKRAVAKAAESIRRGGYLPRRLSREAVRQHALLHHCLNAMKLGQMCSLLAGVGAFNAVEAALATKVGQHVGGEGSAPKQQSISLEADVEDMELHEPVGADCMEGAALLPRSVFFIVLKSRAGRVKAVPLAPAAGSKMSMTSLAITLHHSRTTSDGRVFARTEPAKSLAVGNGVAVLELFGVDGLCLQDGLLAWTVSGAPSISLPAHMLDQRGRVVLDRMSQLGACEGSDVFMTPGCADSLQQGAIKHLEGMGVLISPDGGRWQVSSWALAQMFLEVGLHAPQSVAKAQADLPIADCSEWELIRRLESLGFAWKRMPRAREAKLGLEPLTADGPLVWYSDLGIRKDYVRVLLSHADLFHRGLPHIVHWTTDKKYFKRLLEGDIVLPAVQDAPRRRRLDVGVEPPANLPMISNAVSSSPARPRMQASGEARNELDGAAPNHTFGVSPSGSGEVAAKSSGSSCSKESSCNNSSGDMDTDNKSEGTTVEEAANLGEADQAEDLDTTGAVTPTMARLASSQAGGAASSTPRPASKTPALGDISPSMAAFLEPFDGEGEYSEALHVEQPNRAPAPHEGAQEHRPHRPHRPQQDMLPGSSFQWGPFTITFMPSGVRYAHGGWQARCRFHRLNSRTDCKKAVAISSDIEEAKAVALLHVKKHWCVMATAFNRKRTHGQWDPRGREILPEVLLEARMLAMEFPTTRAETDEHLDALEVANKVAAEAVAKAAAKAKAEAKAKSRSRRSAGAHRRGAARRDVGHAAQSPAASAEALWSTFGTGDPSLVVQTSPSCF